MAFLNAMSKREPEFAWLSSVKFSILFSGRIPRDAKLLTMMGTEKITDIQTLHVMGRADEIVPMAASVKLCEIYTNPVVVQHEGNTFYLVNFAFVETTLVIDQK